MVEHDFPALFHLFFLLFRLFHKPQEFPEITDFIGDPSKVQHGPGDIVHSRKQPFHRLQDRYQYAQPDVPRQETRCQPGDGKGCVCNLQQIRDGLYLYQFLLYFIGALYHFAPYLMPHVKNVIPCPENLDFIGGILVKEQILEVFRHPLIHGGFP